MSQKGTFSRLKEQIEVVKMMYAIRGKTNMCCRRSYRRDCKTEKIDPLSLQTQGNNKIRTPSPRKREYGTIKE
jgi:hypothetical protein